MKPIRWMRSSREDLKAFPEDAKGELGHSLHLVQCGERPRNEKMLHGDLSGVSELVADSEDGNSYRLRLHRQAGTICLRIALLREEGYPRHRHAEAKSWT